MASLSWTNKKVGYADTMLYTNITNLSTGVPACV
jgi:hypothetical protein